MYERKDWCGGDKGVVVSRNRLRRFGHMERKVDGDWVKGYTKLDVAEPKLCGRPRKTWMEVVRNGMRMGLRCEEAQDHDGWRRNIWGNWPTQVKPGKQPLNQFCVCVGVCGWVGCACVYTD